MPATQCKDAGTDDATVAAFLQFAFRCFLVVVVGKGCSDCWLLVTALIEKSCLREKSQQKRWLLVVE